MSTATATLDRLIAGEPACRHPLIQTTARPNYVFCWACQRELRGAEAWLVQRRWDAITPSLGDFFRQKP